MICADYEAFRLPNLIFCFFLCLSYRLMQGSKQNVCAYTGSRFNRMLISSKVVIDRKVTGTRSRCESVQRVACDAQRSELA